MKTGSITFISPRSLGGIITPDVPLDTQHPGVRFSRSDIQMVSFHPNEPQVGDSVRYELDDIYRASRVWKAA